jgi:hypothetical protein
MTVLAPRIPALHGIHCAGDCCNHDAANDLLTTGEDIYSPEWPDKPLRLKPTRGTPRQASARVALRARPDARERGPRVSLDGRPALSPSGSGETLGGGPLDSTLGSPAQCDPSSRHAREARDHLDDLRRPGGNRDAS